VIVPSHPARRIKAGRHRRIDLSVQRYSRSAADARGSPQGDRRDRPTATAGWTATSLADGLDRMTRLEREVLDADL
jgi:hypothetical protein